MKKFIYLILLVSATLSAQSNTEIANIYLLKSQQEINNLDLKKAVSYLEKAKKLLKNKSNVKVEEMGTIIYHELGEYDLALEHAKAYFKLVKNKKSDSYNNILFLYVDIEEKIDQQNQEKEKAEKERLLKIAKEQKLDSLTSIWKTNAAAMSLEADSIYNFDKNGIAPFKTNEGYFGIVNDRGEVVEEASHNDMIRFDGYIVLLTGFPNQVTKINVFESETKNIKALPPVNNFNPLSTHYGKVMKPRSNDLLICYPNNSNQVAVYNLKTNAIRPSLNAERYFKHWKNLNTIKKYNKKNQIKIDKDYLTYGGNLKGYSVFYNESGGVNCFITIGGVVLDVSKFAYLGTLENGFAQAIKPDGTEVWIDESGKQTTFVKDKTGFYSGTTILKKIEGQYQFRNSHGKLIKGDQVLDNLETFLKSNN